LLIGAADEQLRDGVDGAVGRRNVQRCHPAGRGGHGCIGDPPPTRAERAHPVLRLVFASARARSSASTISCELFAAA
jgi:hypothetical protein